MLLSRYGKLLAALAVLMVGLSAFTLVYERTRPRLNPASHQLSSTELQNLEGSNGDRATMAAVREYFLEHPGAQNTRLRVKLAMAAAGEREPDFLFVASEVEQATEAILRAIGEKREPTQKDFEAAGFVFQRMQNYGMDGGKNSWPTPFLQMDIDGDGRKDILFATPGGGWQSSICLLYRNTKEGWKQHRIAINTTVMGIWAFPVRRGGPQVIVIASLLNDVYAPTTLFDVYTWKPDGFRNVLSTSLPYGWQWEHKDTDGDGNEEIRLFHHTSRDDIRYSRPTQLYAAYQWTGDHFALIGKPPAPEIPHWETSAFQPSKAGDAGLSLEVELSRLEALLFERKDFRGSLAALENFEGRIRRADRAPLDKTPLLREVYYYEALCHRKLGNTRRAETILAALWRSHSDDGFGRLAKQWLNVPTDTVTIVQ